MALQHSFTPHRLALAVIALLGATPWQHLHAAGSAGSDYFGDLVPVPSYAVTTGGIYIPTADILDPGVFALQRDTYRDPRFAGRASRSNNTGLTMAFGKYLEINGRLANYPAPGEADPVNNFDPLVLRDLSANFKLKLPRFTEYLPDLAVGITDAGGAANFFDATYGVATHVWGPFKVSAGYGQSSNFQFNGAFGGVEFRPFKQYNVTTLVEDDGRNVHAGVRYITPELNWLNDARFAFTVSRTIGAKDEFGKPHGHTDAGITLHLPLFDRSIGKRLPQPQRNADTGQPDFGQTRYTQTFVEPGTPERIAKLQDPNTQAAGPQAYAKAVGETAESIFEKSRMALVQPANVLSTDLQALQAQVVQLGFTSVRLGLMQADSTHLVLQFDNNTYNRDEVDAYGVAAGLLATKAPAQIKTISLVSSKLGLNVGTLTVDRLKYQLFIAGEPSRQVQDHIQFTPLEGVDLNQVNWLTDKSEKLKGKLNFEPRQVFIAGSELANYDTTIGANGNAYVPLWKGAELFASYTEQLYATNNFGPGKIFGDALVDGWVNISLQQSYVVGGVFNTTTLGEFARTTYGLQQESTKYLGGGDQFVRYRGSYTIPKDSRFGQGSLRGQSLTYSHYLPFFDWTAEATYHRYVTRDTGFELGLKKNFGDIAARLVVRDSELTRVAGLELELPIALRKTHNPIKGFQVNGSNVWRQGIFTVVGSERNDVFFRGLGVARFRYLGGDLFFNRDRNTQSHFKNNLARMRDAFYKYGLPVVQ